MSSSNKLCAIYVRAFFYAVEKLRECLSVGQRRILMSTMISSRS